MERDIIKDSRGINLLNKYKTGEITYKEFIIGLIDLVNTITDERDAYIKLTEDK